MSDIYHAFSGAIAMGCWVAGLFFFRFWNKTHDRIFVIFGVAFWVMGLERVLLVVHGLGTRSEHNEFYYLLRLTGFVLILGGIVDKNRKGT